MIFFQKIRTQGARAAWAPDAAVHWRVLPTLAQTFQRLREYSRANVQAGLERRWHYGILRQYAVFALLALLAGFHDWRWAIAIPALFALRTAKSIWMRADDRRMTSLVNPAIFFTVLTILVTVDMATFAGWAQGIADKVRAGRG